MRNTERIAENVKKKSRKGENAPKEIEERC